MSKWKLWDGNGGCPVAPEEYVRVKLRSGEEGGGYGYEYSWAILDSPSDIVAYIDQHARTEMDVEGYEELADVLRRAYEQAAVGKGAVRHANGEAFKDQVMQDGARRFGVGSLLFQAFKKSEESQRLPLDRGVNELLGAIVYLAGAVIRREADGQ